RLLTQLPHRHAKMCNALMVIERNVMSRFDQMRHDRVTGSLRMPALRLTCVTGRPPRSLERGRRAKPDGRNQDFLHRAFLITRDSHRHATARTTAPLSLRQTSLESDFASAAAGTKSPLSAPSRNPSRDS